MLPAIEQQPADHGEIAHRNAQASLGREQGAVAAEPVGGKVAARRRQHRAGGAQAAEIVADRASVRLVEDHGAADRGVAAGGPVEAGVEPQRL